MKSFLKTLLSAIARVAHQETGAGLLTRDKQRRLAEYLAAR